MPMIPQSSIYLIMKWCSVLILYPEIQEGNAGDSGCINCCIDSSDSPRFQWSLAQCCEVGAESADPVIYMHIY